ncbi:MAG TPA: hypothetical protein VGB54_01570 [Allosphingosinicella sp.]
MKLLFVAAALVVSGPAFAQDAPERDARGIPVVSEEPNVPAGVNQSVTIPPGAQVTVAPASQFFATRPATAAYPPCERGQTDRCTQTYEGRSATRSRRRR